jgi:DNA-directed RNA polymerase specialized sigma24 family protein
MPDEPAPEDQVVLDDGNARLWACLRRLPERCQKLLRIVAAEARPDYGVVSEQLGMPVGSIGPTRGRCLDKLRRELAQAGAI